MVKSYAEMDASHRFAHDLGYSKARDALASENERLRQMLYEAWRRNLGGATAVTDERWYFDMLLDRTLAAQPEGAPDDR